MLSPLSAISTFRNHLKLLDRIGVENTNHTCNSARSSELETTIVTFHSCVFKQPISLFTAFRNAKDGLIHSTTDESIKFLTEEYLLLRNNPPLSATFQDIRIKSTSYICVFRNPNATDDKFQLLLLSEEE